jgi:oxepin-CoA hydrolase/3-oxo-5,6-dehydrosuberyl-CoA semialdehyde dehydrogenase
MMKLANRVTDRWLEGNGAGRMLESAVDGREIASITSDGLDFAAMLDYARRVGGPALRQLTFHQRGEMLKALAKFLTEHKREFYELSTLTGATRSDSWIDIDGGISTLFVYSSKGRREMPDNTVYLDGAPEMLSKNGTFVGQHVYTSRRGAAVHINAFNFPCWGMLEKLAPTLLAGVPAIVKPASSTAYLTECMVRRIVDSGLLPPGALQLVCGGLGDLFEHLTCQDSVAFTGSKATAEKLQQHPRVIAESESFTAETDSLNASILGPDAVPGTPEFDLFVKEVVREMTSKAGQKCTAIRRVIAPAAQAADIVRELSSALGKIRIGNPANENVDMGALASRGQQREVRERVAELGREATLVYGGTDDFDLVDADAGRGAFFMPTLLFCEKPLSSRTVHSVEAFGPVSTVLPYASIEEAIALARLGEGSRVGSIVTNHDAIARELVHGTAPWHGRLLILNRHSAKESTGLGSPPPPAPQSGAATAARSSRNAPRAHPAGRAARAWSCPRPAAPPGPRRRAPATRRANLAGPPRPATSARA